MVFFVEGERCLAASTPVANAAGRMLLATTNPGEAGKVVGVPLGDQEDRTHTHAGTVTVDLPSRSIAGISGGGNGQATGRAEHAARVTSGAATSGLPFVQLLVCQLQSEPSSLPQFTVAYFTGECPGGWDNGNLAQANGRFLLPTMVGGGVAAFTGDPLTAAQDPTHEHHKASGSITTSSKEFVLASGGGNHSLGSAGAYPLSGSTGPSAAGLPYLQLNVCMKKTSASGAAPAGMITFQGTFECSEGWSTVNGAAGRYIVGLPPSGAPSATFGGKALRPGEYRVHSHTMNGVMALPSHKIAGASGCCARGYAGSGDTNFTGATEVDGTSKQDSVAPAPYYTVSFCRKN